MLLRRRLFVLLALLILLSGATFTGGGYAIVDDTPMLAPPGTTFNSIQSALDSGATRIDVRPGTYTETVKISTPNITLNFQDVTIPNDGLSQSVYIAPSATGTTIRGDVCVVGKHDGIAENGDFAQGVAFYVDAANVTLDGVCTENTRSFGIAVNNEAVAHLTIKNCRLSNVATSPSPQLYASIAIQVMGGDSTTVEGCLIQGWSGGIHFWYGADDSTARGNRLENNYGWIGAGGVYTPRAAFEVYGLPDAPVNNTHLTDNEVYGTNGSAFELADVLNGVEVTGNTVTGAVNAFVLMGSGDNKARDVRIAGNFFYGDGSDTSNWVSAGNVAIEFNQFLNWRSDNIGTLFIADGALGDVDVRGNSFINNGRVVRHTAAQGTFRFVGNTVRGALSTDVLYFDNSGNANAIVDSNVIEGVAYRAVNAISTTVTVTNNQVQGGIWVGPGSTVNNNRVTATTPNEPTVYLRSGTVATYNRVYSNGDPMPLVNGATGVLVERNYITRLDSSPANLPNCGTLNTCAGNWTSGQVPPALLEATP